MDLGVKVDLIAAGPVDLIVRFARPAVGGRDFWGIVPIDAISRQWEQLLKTPHFWLDLGVKLDLIAAGPVDLIVNRGSGLLGHFSH